MPVLLRFNCRPTGHILSCFNVMVTLTFPRIHRISKKSYCDVQNISYLPLLQHILYVFSLFLQVQLYSFCCVKYTFVFLFNSPNIERVGLSAGTSFILCVKLP